MQILILVQVIYAVLGTWFAGDLLRGPGSRFTLLNTERIEAYSAAFAPERPPVVALGTSVLKSAVYDWTEASEGVADPVPVLRIVDDHAFFDNFEAVGPAVLAARPRVLVLHAPLLETQPSWQTDISRFRVSQTAWLTHSDDIEFVEFGDVCPSSLGPAGSRLDNPPEVARSQLAEHMEWQASMASRDVDAAVPRRAQALIQQAVDAGITVVILDIPRSPALETHEHSVSESLSARIDALAATSGSVVHLRAPELDDSRFCDLRHLNVQGRREVSAWLMPQLEAILAREGRDTPAELR